MTVKNLLLLLLLLMLLLLLLLLLLLVSNRNLRRLNTNERLKYGRQDLQSALILATRFRLLSVVIDGGRRNLHRGEVGSPRPVEP